MGSHLFFRLFFIFYYLALAGIALYFRQRARGQGTVRQQTKESKAREGGGHLRLRRLSGILMITAALLYIISPPFMQRLQAPLPEWLRWTAVGLGLISLPLLVWVLDALGRMWSRNLQLQESHQLVTNGPYRWVRHPMYLVIFMAMTTVALVSANWLMIVPAVLAMGIIYSRIEAEEAMLHEAFPGEYQSYAQRTGKLLPRFW